MAVAKDKLELKPTTMNHVFLADVDDTGFMKQILVLKKFEDGTIYYVDIDSLQPIDKARIKKIISLPHASNYSCWELFIQNRLENGINALMFFHQNCMKIKRPKGARASTSGLEHINVAGITDKMIGSDFTNPAEAQLDSTTKTFA